ncbi:MAG: hypothetical protein COY42_07065, partial [Armatimonadetes bacterium CG_4_10_14_0_8_um_filter_66_14]
MKTLHAAPALVAAIALTQVTTLRADVYSLKIVTDASPDYSDMDSMIQSVASKWETPRDKRSVL